MSRFVGAERLSSGYRSLLKSDDGANELQKQQHNPACFGCAVNQCDIKGDGFTCKRCQYPGFARVRNLPKQSYKCVSISQQTGSSVYLLRHGESQWNEAMSANPLAYLGGQKVAWTDSPLSALGVKQAIEAASVIFEEAHRHGLQYNFSHPDDAGTLCGVDFGLKEALLPSDDASIAACLPETSLVVTATVGNAFTTPDLEVLSGLKCEQTAMFSSALVRAMDTLQIAMLPFRQNCPPSQVPWSISYSLQELDSNADCTPRTIPGYRPSMNPSFTPGYLLPEKWQAIVDQLPSLVEKQKSAYEGHDILYQYLKYAYLTSDKSKYSRSLAPEQRNIKKLSWRLYKEVCGEICQNLISQQLDYAVATGKSNLIMGGHSIWFRQLFATFGDHDDPDCRALGRKKMANTAIVSAKLLQVEDFFGNPVYVLTQCRFVYLGLTTDVDFEDSSADDVDESEEEATRRTQVLLSEFMGSRF